MRLAIADPPYPRMTGERYDLADGSARVVSRSRATRWYGDHPAAADWDNPARHQQLMADLLDQFDGWAIATSVDGLAAYGTLPAGAQIGAWIIPNGTPSGSRIRGVWEPVILYVPPARRARTTGPSVPNAIVEPSPRVNFTGAKPPRWTWWCLDVLGYQPDADHVADLFPGSGSVTAAIATYPTSLEGVGA